MRIPQNALRHSFASYWLARAGVEGVGRLATIMGNSEAVAKTHYVAALMPEDGDKWFGIKRDDGEPKPAEPAHGIFVSDSIAWARERGPDVTVTAGRETVRAQSRAPDASFVT